MLNLSPEIIEKAKVAKTAEELYEIAKANGIEMTADEAKEFFDKFKLCELDDDLLENVSGGLVQLVNPSSSRL